MVGGRAARDIPRDRLRRALVAWALLACVGAPPALADSAPDLGRPFEPRPASEAVYGVRAPADDPAVQQHHVEAADGVDLFVETWLPAPRDGVSPPQRVPTVLLMTPYASEVVDLAGIPAYVERFVPYGYAFAVGHVRGFGRSGGCVDFSGAQEIDDVARVIEYLGRDAPWSSGDVGMFGISYDAETQIEVAALGDQERTRYLKAIVPLAPLGGLYEWHFLDGVPYARGLLDDPGYLFYSAVVTAGPSSLPTYSEKPGCHPHHLTAHADLSGDVTPYWQQREYRAGAGSIRAAALFVHGLADRNVTPIAEAGLFERIPETTPHKALLGVWEHAFPDSHELQPDWERADFHSMVLAWYDRYLKGLPTGVEDWPAVQVQGTDGQWRAEPDWPTTGGPEGRLALGAGGRLGDREPTGTTSYTEGTGEPGAMPPPAVSATFDTGPLPGRLEVTGQPVLELWVSLDRPDAHVAASLEALDAAGEPVPGGRVIGLRSARHLDPLFENRFVQEQGKAAPTGVPIRIPVRFYPTDVVVPAGGRLRLVISGSVDSGQGPTLPSGAGATVTILHDCEHPSVLRFAMPHADPDLLNVRETDEPADEPLADNRPFTAPESDAEGLSTAPVCEDGA